MGKNGLEINKITAAVLVTGLIMLVSGTIAEALYFKAEGHTTEEPKRGFEIAVAEKPQANGEEAQKEAEVPFDTLLASADPVKGESIAKKCVSCHSFDKGGPNKIGPNLWGVVGHKVASHEGFAYSEAIKNFKGSPNWDVASLNSFITKPGEYIKGTKMTFAGLNKAEDRAALIRYLQTLK